MIRYQVIGHIKGLPYTRTYMNNLVDTEEKAQQLCITMMNINPNKVYYYEPVK